MTWFMSQIYSESQHAERTHYNDLRSTETSRLLGVFVRNSR